MKTPRFTKLVRPNHVMENTNFNKLMEKYLRHELSEKEAAKFKAWLGVMRKENIKEDDLTDEDAELLFQKITNNIDGVGELVAFGAEKGKVRRLMSSTIVRLAASLLFVTVAVFAIWKALDTTATGKNIVAGNEIEKVILNDGTIVWLHKKSKLIYFDKAGPGLRHVELTGEALFEVAKDAENPFTIKCGDITVKVVGTSFSLKTGNENIELTVLTGKVNLSSPADRIGIEVSPYEKAIYNEKGMVEKIPLEKQETQSITANTEYNMNFENSSLAEIFNKIEKKFDVRISVVGGEFSNCRVTTDLSDQSLELSLQSLNELVKLTYKIDKNSVVISGQGCN